METWQSWTTFCMGPAHLNLSHPRLSALSEYFLVSCYEWSFTKTGHNLRESIQGCMHSSESTSKGSPEVSASHFAAEKELADD